MLILEIYPQCGSFGALYMKAEALETKMTRLFGDGGENIFGTTLGEMNNAAAEIKGKADRALSNARDIEGLVNNAKLDEVITAAHEHCG